MPDETISENDAPEGNGEAISAMALIRARKAALARMEESRAKVEENETSFESGGDLWNLLRSVNRD